LGGGGPVRPPSKYAPGMVPFVNTPDVIHLLSTERPG